MKRLLLALLLATAMAAPASASAAGTPVLRLESRAPLALHGLHFRSGERVTVVVRAARSTTRSVLADDAGSFTVTFGRVPVSRCGGVAATATGSLGSSAALKLQLPACSAQ